MYYLFENPFITSQKLNLIISHNNLWIKCKNALNKIVFVKRHANPLSPFKWKNCVSNNELLYHLLEKKSKPYFVCPVILQVSCV